MIDRIDGHWFAHHPAGIKMLCRTKRDAQRLDRLAHRYDKALWEYYARALYSPAFYAECEVPA